jgi:predicted Zn finger-like uncharacterized protein
MPQTWKASEARETACPQCQSRYEVTVTRLPVRDRDSYLCDICNHEMATWHSTDVPSYRLIEAKPWPPNPA